MLGDFTPLEKDCPFHDVAQAIKLLAKHFARYRGQCTGKMPQLNGPPASGSGAPPGAMLPLGGGAEDAMLPRGCAPTGGGMQ